jgi:beta-glucosidase
MKLIKINLVNNLCKEMFLIFILSVIVSGQLFSFPAAGDERNKLPLSKKEEARIDSIVKVLTLEEKIDMLHGSGIFTSAGVKRFGIDELHYTDGPHGIREEDERNSFKPIVTTLDSSTFFPTGSALAATWNPDLALKYGTALGEEARTRGKDMILGPAINITRTPVNGRTFEYMSEDPFLNSRLAANYIKGVQSNGVVACVKHYAVNNQETNRSSVSVAMDERTLREIYLPAFKAAITEGRAYSIMSAYNKFRESYCSENDYLLNKILRGEWGFKGIVVSDWGGTHSTVNCAINGLDVEMGSYRKVFFADSLLKEVRNGKVPEDVINDKVKRILGVMLYTQRNRMAKPGGIISTPEHNKVAYEVASQSIVLLKNSDNILPLNSSRLKKIVVIGDNALHKHATGGFGAGVKARYEVTPLAGLQNALGIKVQIQFVQGYKPSVDTINYKKYERVPAAKADQSLLNEAVAAAKNSDAAIIFAGTNHDVETEATDRRSLALPYGQDELIKAVTAANPKTIVVVVAGAPTDLNAALQTSPAVLYSWYNGSQGGNAIADVLFGKVNPSGRLPFTFPVNLNDSPAHFLKTFPGENFTANYAEGILVGYRWYDTKNILPQLCFGYGLSYTKFDYSPISLPKPKFKGDGKIKFSVNVKNSGQKSGYETVQIYFGKENSKVPRAEKELKAFKKVLIAAGKNAKVNFEIDAKDLAYYNMDAKAWQVEPGKYKLIVGSSSRDIRATSEITID